MRARARSGAALWVGLTMLPSGAIGVAPATPAAGNACQAELEAHRVGSVVELAVAGRVPVEVALPAGAGHEFLVVADERGNDVSLDLFVADGTVVQHSDNPVRRSGRQSAIGAADAGGMLRIRLTGKEHDAVTGRVAVAVYDPTGMTPDRPCLLALQALAAADASYARGQDVSLGRRTGGSAATRHAYLVAAEEYRRAYGLLASVGDDVLAVSAAHALAAVYYQDLQDWTRSEEWAQRTAAIAGGLQRDYEAARARALLAAAWIELAPRASQSARSTTTPAATHARFEEARALLRQLERFHRLHAERYDAALQLNNIGVADLYEARYAAAQATFARAGREFALLHERPRQGLALQNEATAEWGRGDLIEAARTFRRALELLTPEPYPKLYLFALANSALVHFAIGDFDESLRLHARALAFARAVAARAAEGNSLYGLGVTYYALGDHDLAQRYLEASLALRPAGVDARGRVASLRALSTLYGDGQRYTAAVAVDEEALALSSTAPARARMLVRLGADQAATGQVAAALQAFATVLEESSGADAGARIEAWTARGHVHRLAGDAPAAEHDLRAALALLRRHDSPDAQFRAELELAIVLRSMHRPSDALAAVDRALARGEELRRQTANPEFRAALQAPLRPAFDLKLSLLAEHRRQLLERGERRDADQVALAALATAESGRAQALTDLASLKFPSRTPQDLRSALVRRERLYRDLAARRFRLAERDSSAPADDLVAIALRSDIAGLRLALDTLNAEIARRTGTVAGAAPFAARELAAWLRRRAPGTAIVEYWLGADDAYAWTITRDGVRWTSLGASGPISDAARALHAALRNTTAGSLRERRELAAALYDRILRPLGGSGVSGRTLIAVPDGALHYVPFAALRTGHAASAHYLVEERDVAVTPAARWLMRPRPPSGGSQAPSRFLLVSDPIYRGDDERLRGPLAPQARPAAPDAADADRFGDLRRLPWTARETSLVAALLPPAAIDQLSGAGATRAAVLALDWTRYRVIHFASHGVVDAGMPQLSALVLSAFDERGERVEQSVRASDLADRSLNAEVVALSACDTALGKEIAGEGAVGLASTAMARGAASVLASLWQAPDEMSARLMTEFYRGMLTRDAGPVAALGGAMRAVLAADHDADPTFWAVFQLSVSQPDPRTPEGEITGST